MKPKLFAYDFPQKKNFERRKSFFSVTKQRIKDTKEKDILLGMRKKGERTRETETNRRLSRQSEGEADAHVTGRYFLGFPAKFGGQTELYGLFPTLGIAIAIADIRAAQ